MRPVSVFVGGLNDDINREDLEREFSKFGTLNKVWVARNPPGFAFIEFEEEDDANEAIKEMNGASINGSEIRVDMSRNNGRGRGRGGRRGGGFRGGRGGGGGYDSGYASYGGRGGGGSRYGGGGGGGSSYSRSSFGGGDDYRSSGYRSRSPFSNRNGSSW